MSKCLTKHKMPSLSYSYYHDDQHNDNVKYLKGYGGHVPNFMFRKRYERIDWRKMASIDVDHVTQTMDIGALQDNLMNVTFCNIETELDLRMVDPNFVKIFKMAQLIIEYLLNSQDYLSNVVIEMEEKINNLTEEHKACKDQLDGQTQVLEAVKKESHKRKKLLTAQQHLITGASVSTNKCPYCPKSFITAAYLRAHTEKRHSKVAPTEPRMVSSSSSISDAVSKELAGIKERLQLTEMQISKDHAKLQNFEKTHTENKENKEGLVNQLTSHRDEGISSEMEKMREVHQKEMQELMHKYEASLAAIQELKDAHPEKKSNLGTLRDDVDVEDLVMQQKAEMAAWKKNLESQMLEMRQATQEKLTKRDKRWSQRMKDMTEKHKNEIAILNQEFSAKTQIVEEPKHAALLGRDELNKKRNNDTSAKPISNKFIQESRTKKEIVKPSKKVKSYNKKKAVIDPPETTSPHPPSSLTPVILFDLSSDDSEIEKEHLEEPKTNIEPVSSPVTKSSLNNSSITSEKMASLSFLKSDPGFMKGMRDEVKTLLDKKLKNIGVSLKARSLPKKLLDIKSALLSNERKAKEKQFSEFTSLRQKFSKDVKASARLRLKPKRHAHFSMNDIVKSQQSPVKVNKPQFADNKLSAKNQQNESPRRPPLPTSHNPVTSRKPIASRSLQSTSSTTEWTSSQQDSDNDFDRNGSHQLQMPSSENLIGLASVKSSSSPVPAPRVKAAVTLPADLSDWDSDIISDPDDEAITKANENMDIKQKSRIIESKLSARGQRPIGGVDLIKHKSSAVVTPQSSKDEDLFDISSFEENLVNDSQKRSTGYVRDVHNEAFLATTKWGSDTAKKSDLQDDDGWDSDSI